jgi:hypothetical protein
MSKMSSTMSKMSSTYKSSRTPKSTTPISGANLFYLYMSDLLDGVVNYVEFYYFLVIIVLVLLGQPCILIGSITRKLGVSKKCSLAYFALAISEILTTLSDVLVYFLVAGLQAVLSVHVTFMAAVPCKLIK